MSLDALSRGFKQNLSSGIANFHEVMNPSNDELLSLQPEYMGLVAGESEKVASFALKMLKKVEQAKILDDAAYVQMAPDAFAKKGKGLAKTVLVQLKKIAKRSAALQRNVLEVIAETALSHVNGDIQLAALEFLRASEESLDEQLREAIGARIDDLPPTLQSEARTLVGEVDSRKADLGDGPAEVADLRKRASALPARWRNLAGVDDALASLDGGPSVGPLALDRLDIPVLAGVASVSPLSSVDDLLDLTAQAIEGVESALDVERILDGISRLGGMRDGSFEKRAAPILARLVKTHYGGDGARGIVNGWGTVGNMEKLLVWWLSDSEGANATEEIDRWRPALNLEDFMEKRIEEILDRVTVGAYWEKERMRPPVRCDGRWVAKPRWITKPMTAISGWRQTAHGLHRPSG